MARSRHTLGSLFAHILTPVTTAIEAETGTKLSAPQWATVARRVAASWLRSLAAVLDVTPTVNVPTGAVVPEEKPAPMGWDYVETGVPPCDAPAPAVTVVGGSEHSPILEVVTVATTNKPKAAPSAARATKKPSKPAKAAPAKKPAKAPGKPAKPSKPKAAPKPASKPKAPAKGKPAKKKAA